VSDGLTDIVLPDALRPIKVAPDANIFTFEPWVERLKRGAERGRVRLYWSPKTVEEVGRVRLWIWIKRVLRTSPAPTGSSAWKALWERYSGEAHLWFAEISPLIEVAEDRPPHEPAWADPHPDPNDAWLWNGARRAGAHIVLTANLRDAPPPDGQGVRQHDDILFVHPDAFVRMLDVWEEIVTTSRTLDTILGAELDGPALSALRRLLARIEREPPAPAGGSGA